MENDLKISQLPQVNTISGEELYVVASNGHNYSVTGNTLKEFATQNLQEKEKGKGLSSNDYTTEDKEKVNSLPTSEQLKEDFAKKQDTLKSSEDIDVSEDAKLSLTDRAKLELFVSQWKAATLGNGGFNWDTLLGSLNGIDDLTIEDMQLIMWEGRKSCCTPNTGIFSRPPIGTFSAIRTNVLVDGSDELRQNHPSMDNFCYNQIALEVFRIGQDSQFSFSPSNLSSSFTRCHQLREIKGWIMCDYVSKGITCTRVFNECESLEEVRLCKLSNSIEMMNSPLISLASLQFLVEKAANTTPITVSVHKDVYAKLTDESNAEWHKVLTDASEKDISFATIS